MKKTSITKSRKKMRDLLTEYRFDYSKARPNRFAARFGKANQIIILDPDISKVFHSSKKVNEILRALIKTMPRG